MDYEKAYKDALERAKAYHRNELAGSRKEMTEYIFPELAESEDELVMNWLLVQLETNYKGNYWASKAVAWLEKQKESLHISESCKENPGSFTDEDERMRKLIIDRVRSATEMTEGLRELLLTYLEKQKERVPENAETGTQEQKPTDEDERIRKALIDLVSTVGEYYLPKLEARNKMLAYLEKQKEPKQTDLPAGFYYIDLDGNKYYSKEFRYGDMKVKVGEQKPAEWSEEEDQLIGFIFDLLNDLFWRKDWAMSKEECLERLNSLRPKVNANSEKVNVNWSEEDNNAITTAIRACRYITENFENSTEEYEDAIKRLKSLRPQWKPSEEQMKALQNAVALTACDKELARLYNQLKKLM